MMNKVNPNQSGEVRIPAIEIYGKGYKRFVECRKRYICLKGGRGSKKSRNTALRFILLLHEYPESNLLCVRRYMVHLKQSTRATLIWAIKRLRFDADWDIPKGNLTLTRKSTGQQILFRGMDDPLSLTSITVEQGYLNFMWVEEAFQIEKEEDFNTVDEGIRGIMPQCYFLQTVLTLNPWNDKHWIKRRFFDMQEGERLDGELPYTDGMQKSTADMLCITRNYECNEWLDETTKKGIEDLKLREPARYRVVAEGRWGVSKGAIYDKWEVRDFNPQELFYVKNADGKPRYEERIGCDFGWSDQFAAVRLLVDHVGREIYVCGEIYQSRLSNFDIAAAMKGLGWDQKRIHADSENPKDIDFLQKHGLPRIFGVKKGQGSVGSGIQKIRGYNLIIHPTCEESSIAIQNYRWKTNATGKEMPTPEHAFSHIPDAIRYAMEDGEAGVVFGATASIGTQAPHNDSMERERLLKGIERIRRGGYGTG